MSSCPSRFPYSRTLFAGALVGALLALSTGCEMRPDKEDTLQTAIQRYRAKQTVESMADLREVLEQDRNHSVANYYMGLNYRAIATRKFQAGDVAAARKAIDSALVYYNQAIKSWPNYMNAIAAKNEALESRGKYDDALAFASKSAEINRGSSADHYVYLGEEYRQRGDYDNALRNYQIAISSEPNSARAYAGLGKLYFMLGDKQRAADALQHAYELNAAEPEVADLLAQLTGEPIMEEEFASPPPAGVPEQSSFNQTP